MYSIIISENQREKENKKMTVTVEKTNCGFIVKNDEHKLRCIMCLEKQAIKNFRITYNLKGKHFDIIRI